MNPDSTHQFPVTLVKRDSVSARRVFLFSVFSCFLHVGCHRITKSLLSICRWVVCQTRRLVDSKGLLKHPRQVGTSFSGPARSAWRAVMTSTAPQPLRRAVPSRHDCSGWQIANVNDALFDRCVPVVCRNHQKGLSSTHTHTHTHISTHADTHTHRHTHSPTNTCLNTNDHTHTHTHTQTHTNA